MIWCIYVNTHNACTCSINIIVNIFLYYIFIYIIYSYIIYSYLSLYLYQSTFEHYGWNSCTAIMSCNSTGIRFFRFSNVWGRPVFPRQKEIPSTQQRLHSWKLLNLGRGYSEPKNTLFFPHKTPAFQVAASIRPTDLKLPLSLHKGWKWACRKTILFCLSLLSCQVIHCNSTCHSRFWPDPSAQQGAIRPHQESSGCCLVRWSMLVICCSNTYRVSNFLCMP